MAAENRRKQDDSSDTMKILVATDIHLGYMEKDPIRGNDSINTFEEILRLGKENNVDFVLLGGDLFHDNKPSRKIMHGAISLLRQYCLGDKPVQLEFLSDQSLNFGHTSFPCVNYEDPNLNVEMPVFSIHGNHDDPAGLGSLCSLDILAACGLINYFGKHSSLDKIEIRPLLMCKGNTRLALYGLGAIKDERLHRMFEAGNVTMLRPREDAEQWVNVFVLHQNRSKHGEKNYIPEHFLDDFIDLVIWGHEHECSIMPSSNGVNKFLVSQPGSSIATSLSEGETKDKYVGLLSLCKTQWNIKPLRLETVRPFKMEDIILSDTSLNPCDAEVTKKAEMYCTEKVECLLQQAASERTGNPCQPDKPLIRIRVDYSNGFEPFNKHRFSQKFVDRVANPKDIVLFHRHRELKPDMAIDSKFEIDAGFLDTSLSSCSVEDMIKEFFNKADKASQLNLLTVKGLGRAVREFVDKEENSAIPELVKYQIEKTKEYLRRRNVSEDVIEEEISRYQEERKHKPEEEELEINEVLSHKHNKAASKTKGFDDDNDSEDAAKAPLPKQPTQSTRGSRGRRVASCGRGARGKRQSSAASQNASIADMFASNKQRVTFDDNDDDDDDDIQIIHDSDLDDDKHKPVSTKPRSQRKTSVVSRASTTHRGIPKGIMWDDDDDVDEDDFNPMKKLRR